MHELTVTACHFKRTKDSPWEAGIMINQDRLIIDCKVKPVEAPIHDYRLELERGHAVFRG